MVKVTKKTKTKGLDGLGMDAAKKKGTLWLAMLGLGMLMLWVPQAQAQDSDSDGVADSSDVDDDGDGLIEIRTLKDLNEETRDRHFRRGYGCPSSGCTGYELMNDLDFTDTSATGYNANWNPVVQLAKPESERSTGWAPVGGYSNPFTGTFEGNDSEIKNLYVNTKSLSRGVGYGGLFGRVRRGEIRNLHLTGEDTHVRGAHVGVLAGIVVGTTLTNCSAVGEVVATAAETSSYAGGLVGVVDGTADADDESKGVISTLTNCYATADVSASGLGRVYVGGLVGYCGGWKEADGTIKYSVLGGCYATGSVRGSGLLEVWAGGLVGNMRWTKVRETNENKSYATGLVEVVSGSTVDAAYHNYVGGLVGAASDSEVSDSYASGSVTASGVVYAVYAGGLVGGAGFRFSADLVEGVPVMDCYATGVVDVSGSYGFADVGGLVGSAEGGDITNCYATGAVSVDIRSGDAYAGGLAGFVRGKVIRNSYAVGSVTATGASSSGRGLFGGLAGTVAGKEDGEEVLNCYSTGKVNVGGLTAEKVWFGGLVGVCKKVKTSYTLSELVAGSGSYYHPGGLVGSLSRGGTADITASYHTTTAVTSGSSLTLNSLGTRKTETELQSPTTAVGIYSSWDTKDWDFGTSSEYPKLRTYKENSEGNQVQGDLLEEKPKTPTYTVGTPTKTTIPLTGGSPFTGGANRRRFFVSKVDLGPLMVDFPSDGQSSGVDMSNIWTMVSTSALASVTIGSGTPATNKELEAGTRYYIRVMDYKEGGQESGLSADLGARTVPSSLSGPIVPPTYTVGTPTKTTIPLTGGSAPSGGATTRRFYVSKSPLFLLTVGDLADGGAETVSGVVSGTSVWTFALSEDLEEVTIGSKTPAANKELEVGTRYYVRVVDYESSSGERSEFSADFGAMTSGLVGVPIYTVGDPTTTTIPLTGGSRLSRLADSRRFFVSKNDLTNLAVTDAKTGTYTGVTSARTFVLTENLGSVTIGMGGLTGNDRPLEDGVRYYVRALDYRSSDGRKSELSRDLGATTLKVIAKPTYTVGDPTTTTIPLTSGSAITAGVADTRRFFVSKNDLMSLVVTDAAAGTFTGVSDVWTFTSTGDVSTVTIGAGLNAANQVLEPETRHYVRAIDYDSSTGRSSEMSDDLGGTTAVAEVINPPAYKGVSRITHNSLTLTGGSSFTGSSNGRIFYVSKNDLSALVVLDPDDKSASGVSGADDVYSFGLAMGFSTVTIGDGTPVENTALEAGTKYYVRALDYDADAPVLKSALSEMWQATTTVAEGIYAPEYTVEVVTEHTIPLTGGSVFTGEADMRRFYVSESSLEGLVVDNPTDHAISGVMSSDVWTFSLSGDFEEVTIGGGKPEENKRLSPGVRYYVRTVDYRSSDGSKSDLSADLGARTFDVIDPPTYRVGRATHESVVLSGGSSFRGGANRRRFYVSKSDLSGLSVSDVRDDAATPDGVWTFALTGRRVSTVTIGSGSPAGNEKLESGTLYYVVAIDYHSSQKRQSGLSEVWELTTTAAEGSIGPPTYTLGSVTHDRIVLTGGSSFSGEADMRRFYVSKSDLEPLTVGNAVDHAVSGVSNEVWTFTLDAGEIETVTIGDGTPPSNKRLEVGTRYYVRAVDYKSSDGTKSDKSADLGATTTTSADAINAPTYTLPVGSYTTITLRGGSPLTGVADMRRFYVSENDLDALSVVNVRDGASSGAADVWTFTLGKGATEEVTIGNGKPEANKALKPGTPYSVRALDYRESDGRKSALSGELYGTATTSIFPPTYTVGRVTHNSIALMEGSSFVEAVDRRRFFVSKNDLSGLSVTNAKDGTFSGVADVWTFVLSENLGTVTVGSGEPEANKTLEAGTKYYIGAMDYHSSKGWQSAVLSLVWQATTTAEGVINPPAYIVSSVTHNSIVLTGGVLPDGGADMRRFYVSKTDLGPLVVGNAVDHAVSGVGSSEVRTFTLSANFGTVTIGDGALEGNEPLDPGTRYYVRAVDYKSLDGTKSAKSLDLGGTTTTAAGVINPPAYAMRRMTHNSLVLTGGSPLTGGASMRRFYISESDLASLMVDNAVDHAVSGLPTGTDVWTFALGRGKTSTVTIGDGTPLANKRLEVGTRYYVRAVDYKSDGTKSALSEDLGGTTTDPDAVSPPTYTVSRVTHNSIVLAGGSGLGGADMRRFYVSKSNLAPLMVDNVVDHAVSGVLSSKVWTFTLGAGETATVTIGSGEPEANEVLEAGTKYYVRAIDYHSSEDRQSDLSEVWQATTTTVADVIKPPTYTVNRVTHSRIVLAKGSPFTGEADMRRFYVSKNDLDDLDVVNVRDGASDGVAEVWTFVLSENLGTVAIGSGEPDANRVLEARTKYYVRAMDYHSSGDRESDLSAVWQATTTAAEGVISPPTYTVGKPTRTSIPLTKGSPFSGDADMRRFYVSESNLKPLTVGNAVDHAVSGVRSSKVWTFTLGAEEISAVTIGSGEPKANKKLKEGTRYYVRAVDYHSVEDRKSELSKVWQGTTTKASVPVINPPTYTVGTPTQTSIPLTGGSAFSGDADRRRFFVSKNDLNALVVTNAKDGTSSGVSDVWTFALSENTETVTIGSGSPEGNKALEANTRYYVRAIDYKESDGKKSDLSGDLGGATAPKPPRPVSDPVWGTLKSEVYAYPNPTSGVLHVPVSSGVAVVYGSDGSKIGSFEVSAGQIDLSDLPAGAYVVRLSGHVLRVVKQ